MTDKIFPEWINDRLPTKKDGNKVGLVYRYSGLAVYVSLWNNIIDTDYWTAINESVDSRDVATPQECINREKPIKIGMDFMMSDFGDEETRKTDSYIWPKLRKKLSN